jgi:hypothetical protein
MIKHLIVLLLLLIVSHLLYSQILPQEEAKLNYRIIGFSFPALAAIDSYRIEIAYGKYNDDAVFEKNIITSVSDKKNKIVAEVPAFGKNFTWRTVCINNRQIKTKGVLHHFSTDIAIMVDTDSVRLRITAPALEHKDDYVFVDATQTLYNMSGKPVWFVPARKEYEMLHYLVLRDLKRTPFNTMSFMVGEGLYEIDYNGNILWQGPGNNISHNDSAILKNIYHHEFTRRSTGNYMALRMERVWWQLPFQPDTTIHGQVNRKIKWDTANHKLYQQIVAGFIDEFDKNGNKIWTWSASDYLQNSDLSDRKKGNGYFNLEDTHENAFFFDEKSQEIYVSFRNINRILKLQYPSGKVLSTYGTRYTPGDLELNNDQFCGQHSCRVSKDGYLYFFNNNTCNNPCQLPTIAMMKRSASKKDLLEKVWEYQCTVDGLSETEQPKLLFESGGSVFELADGSVFCCMGNNPYCKTFIVSHDKRVLWSAIPEVWNKNKKDWVIAPSYRATIITHKQLEDLIWATTKN